VVAYRSPVGILAVAILSLAMAVPEAAASPARRLARRGVLLVPPPGTAILPPAGPLRPNPLLAVPVAPGGPSVVIGPGGRVRRRLTIPPAAGPAAVVTVTETVTVPVPAAVVAPPSAAVPHQAAVRPAPAPATAAVKPPSPAAPPMIVEQIPAPLPTPQPGPAGGVVPAGAELDIPDGTQSVLVQPAGGDTPR